MSPRAKSFKANSIIYFEGDKGDLIYLLKEGKISLTYSDVTTGEELVDQISAGEFFGVKSGLIHHSREESAKVITNSVVFEFFPVEFEALIIKNPNIIIKMLRAFSNQLKKVHKQIQNIVGKNVSGDSADNFFNIGDYYLKNKKYKQSITVYKRYLNYYPNGTFSLLAKKRLKIAQEALEAYGDEGGPAPILEKAENTSGSSLKNDFQDLEQPENEVFDIPPGSALGENEENIETDEIDNNGTGSTKESKLYYKAVSYMSQGKYMDAFHTLKIVINNGNDQEKRMANAEIGKCLYHLKKYNETIKHLTNFLANNQNYNDKDEILYYLGSSYSQIGDADKAEKIFNNLISNHNESDPIYRRAQKALKELG